MLKKSQKFIVLGLILALLGLLAGCSAFPRPAATAEPTPLPAAKESVALVAEGRVVPSDSVELSFAQGGIVDEVLVEKGDLVKAGDVLARLSNREQLEAAIANSERELTDAKQALEDLNDQAETNRVNSLQEITRYAQEVKSAQYQLDNFTVPSNQQGLSPIEGFDAMRAKLDVARAAFEPYRNKPSSDERRKDLKEDLDNAQADFNSATRRLELQYKLDVATTNLEKAREDYAKWENGADPEKVVSAQARIAAAEAGLASAQANFRNLELRATIDGTVVDLNINPGDAASPGQPVVSLADFSQWYVETDDLTEIEVVEVQLGQKVTVVPDALPDLELAGTVEEISDTFQEKQGDVTYTVRIRLDEVDPRLRWGMTVVVTFE